MNADSQALGIVKSEKHTNIPAELKSKILVVDDEKEIVDLLTYNLCRNNYEVLFAMDGAQALQRAKSELPDLIILDSMLPQMSGPEVAVELKRLSKTSHIPIIFLTARSDTNSIVEGLGTGASDYITKPFSFVELMARIETQLKLKKSVDQLKKAEMELRMAESARDKLFTTFVHDIRAPFHSFGGFIERLHSRYDQLPDAERKKTIEIIRQSANYAQLLLSNLLQWTCLQNGLFQWSPQKINLRESITKIRHLLATKLDEKGIDLEISVSENIFVFADPSMVEAVLRNLLQNAIKFTPDGGRIILNSTSVGDSEEISIADNGVGIDRKQLETLFDIEHCAPGVDLQGEKSTGLGLVLCKEFVELNGGFIWVRSVQGEGSKFFFTLPRFC